MMPTINARITLERQRPTQQALADALADEISGVGDVQVDESNYLINNVDGEPDGEHPEYGDDTPSVVVWIKIDVERTEGKFVSNDDLAEEILGNVSEIEIDDETWRVIDAAPFDPRAERRAQQARRP